jgi:RNA polymerase sigma factor (sigma-70 family)
MKPDSELLAQYAIRRDEGSFAELARRHIDHVYSTALRLVGGDTHLAEDVTQAVFVDLARKASSLRECRALSGWLHTSTRYAAAKLVRTEQRRREREQTIVAMTHDPSSSEPEWEQVRSVLDDSISELCAPDRDALLLRFFERKAFAEIGSLLGLSENAARMRVHRAVDKLRERLSARGITSTSGALGAVLTMHAVGFAPTGLAARLISQVAAVKPASWFTLAGPTQNAAAVLALCLIGGAVLFWNSRIPQPPPATAVTAQNNRLSQAVPNPRVFADSGGLGRPSAAEPSGLELLFLDDQSGLPITNQFARFRLVGDQHTLELVQGRCVLPLPQEARSLRIWTHIDDYADKHLRWHPDQGEVVPELYVVRLVRPVLIHGQVVDPLGRPLANATVAFGNNIIPGREHMPEVHHLNAASTTTDDAGRWLIRRVAPELLDCLEGGASHPHYVEARVSVFGEAQAAQQLLDGTFVFRLGPAASVRGRVIDDFGNSVSNALVTVGHQDHSKSRQTRSAVDGTFSVTGCSIYKQPITAHADGFAPATISMDIQPGMPEVILTLRKGKALRVRIVNGFGAPVPNATVYYDFLNDIESEPLPQVNFEARTDSEGRIVWLDAPEQALPFCVNARGYLEARSVVRPADEEHVITLVPALVISGTVRDAQSGELLPRFRLCIGHLAAVPGNDMEPRWLELERFRPLFSGGQFYRALEEAISDGGLEPVWFFRVEAEGYASHVTRGYGAEEGEVRLDVQLSRTQQSFVGIYTPAGDFAAEAHVGLFPRPSRLRAGPGGFARGASTPGGTLRRADAQGRFLLPEDEEVREVAIAHPDGYIEISAENLRKARAVRLQPWGRVEGFGATSPGEAGIGWGASLRRIVPELPGERRLLSAETYEGRSDAYRRIAFPYVPPGVFELALWEQTAEGRTERSAAAVEIRSGETLQISFSDTMESSRR